MAAAALIAALCVVLPVDGGEHTFMPGEPLPELPADEAARLVALGAAREAVVEGQGKPGKGGKGKHEARPAADAPASGAEASSAGPS